MVESRLTGEKRRNSENKLLQCHSSPQISHWVICELNLGLPHEKPACNHLSYKNQNYACLEMFNLDPQTKFNRDPVSGFRNETWWCPDTHILSVASNLSASYNYRLETRAVVVHLKTDKMSTVFKLNYNCKLPTSNNTVRCSCTYLRPVIWAAANLS
jgi:hypothetical protein